MTHLLDSWMRAMAMRILVRRKMMVRRRIASTTEMMITEVKEIINEKSATRMKNKQVKRDKRY